MNIHLTREVEQLVQNRVQSGRYNWDAASDTCTCPNGEILCFRKNKNTERVRIYQAPGDTRTVCPLQA